MGDVWTHVYLELSTVWCWWHGLPPRVYINYPRESNTLSLHGIRYSHGFVVVSGLLLYSGFSGYTWIIYPYSSWFASLMLFLIKSQWSYLEVTSKLPMSVDAVTHTYLTYYLFSWLQLGNQNSGGPVPRRSCTPLSPNLAVNSRFLYSMSRVGSKYDVYRAYTKAV